MKYAAGYLRRSSVSGDSPGDASREAQEASVRRLGATVLYADWGVSGRRDDRAEYVKLKADITSGKVSAVYAYSLSRLGRNARELDALFSLCEDHGVPVQTEVEGALAGKGAFGGFIRRVLAALAELESELARERSSSARTARLERGDRIGHPPFGFRAIKDAHGVRIFVPDPERPAAAVLAAYAEAGTVQGAARMLNTRGVPSPKGKRWGTSETRRVLVAHGADLPAHGKPGRRALRVPYLAKLLRCHCGGTLTPNVTRGQYYCPRAKGNPDHGRYNVTEASLMPWVMEEAGDLPDVQLRQDATREVAARRDDLVRRRRAVIDNFEDGDITRDEKKAKLSAIDAELEALEAPTGLVALPEAIDWEHDDPAAVNGVLRTLWRFVELDANLRPVRAEWRFGA